MKVLITGGAGFVGRRLRKRCVAEGYSVVVVDNFINGRKRQFRDTEGAMVVPMDVRDFVKSADRSYDLVFHCAAVVGGRATIDGAPLKVATDLSIDAEFFNWCCSGTKQPKKVVYFSSSAVYPVSLQTPMIHVALNESLAKIGADRIGMPDQTYGWAKLSGEVLMKHAVDHYGLNCVCYRPFSGYGEDQDFDYPFPSIIRRIGNRENPIEVWGTGEQVRDFIHIDDVVDAIFASYDKMKPGETLNLGTGEGVSFLELIKRAKKVIGHKAKIKILDDKPVGVFSRVADIYNMRQYYTPKISLEEGIKRVHEYQKTNGLLTGVPEQV